MTTILLAQLGVQFIQRLKRVGFLAPPYPRSSVKLISSTVTAADVNTKFRDVTTPVITWEPLLFDDMAMTSTSTTDYGTATGQTQVSFLNSTHPLSAGLCVCTPGVFVTADTMSWGIPSAGAIKIATLASDANKATIFGYDKGASMVGLTAPGRRVGLLFHDTSCTSKRGCTDSRLRHARIFNRFRGASG
jgi:hypothetical protein